ncbi:MAG: hypothetical protein AB8I08_01280 [Sandaracinaceae bacterium]
MTAPFALAAALFGGLLPGFTAIAEAQPRHTESVPVLNPGRLAAQLASSRGAVSSCAGRADTDAFLTEVRATVSPGPAPSTMYNARIRVTVRSRPRDHGLESCVRRVVQDALRHRAEAVRRPVRANHTFRIAGRPPTPRPVARAVYSDRHAHAALSRLTGPLQRCLEQRGVADSITLHVTVDRAGRLSLTNATLPAGSPSRALGCMAGTVSRARLGSAAPRGRVTLRHTLRLR